MFESRFYPPVSGCQGGHVSMRPATVCSFFNSSATATQTASIQMESGKSGFLFQEEQWTSSESEKVKCSSWHGANIKECKTSKAYGGERRHGREGNMRRVVMTMLYFHAQF